VAHHGNTHVGAPSHVSLVVSTLNLETEKKSTLPALLAGAKFRRPSLIAAFALGFTITVLLTVLLPPHYRSAGTILIEQQEMPQDLVRSTITSYADERIQVISKRVMTTETLLGIIRRYDLYPKERANATREALIKQMRKDIGLHMISADVIDPRSGHPTSATIAFEISYTSKSADLAAKVANELTTLYLNENLQNRTQLARDAATFLGGEGDRLNHRIGELEAQLARFKDKHYRQLPELTPLNMQMMEHLGEELRSQAARKSSLEQQKVFLEAQLVQLKPNSTIFSDTGERIMSSADRLKMARQQLDSARSLYSPAHPDVIRLEREVKGLEAQAAASGKPADSSPGGPAADLKRQLEGAQATLADVSGRYGPEHPDRMKLERTVQSLQAQIAATAPAPPAPSSLTIKEADNPAYVQIQAQLSATVNELAALDTQVSKLNGDLTRYQDDLTLSPKVEQEYRELMRDYDNTRLQYAQLRAKLVEASTAQNLEADRKGERFTLIDPPLPPEEPVSPNRILLFVGGLFFSVALTVGFLWLREKLDTSVRGRLDLMELTGLPPLALVPHIQTESQLLTHRRRVRVAFGSAMASLCLAVAMTHFLYKPLDVLWFTFARRMGF
jgi:succinoglycan biosynthesis transport protein ExoP